MTLSSADATADLQDARATTRRHARLLIEVQKILHKASDTEQGGTVWCARAMIDAGYGECLYRAREAIKLIDAADGEVGQ